MFDNLKNIKYYQYFVFALVMTLFSYYFELFRIDEINNIKELALLGSPGFSQEFSHYMTNRNIILPPIIFWAILGILAYFVYYSLNVLYYLAYNNAVVQVFYTKNAEKSSKPIKIKKRILFHGALVILYLFLIGIFLGILTPLSISLRNIIISNNETFYYLSIAVVYAYWLTISSFFGIFIHFLKIEEEEVDLSEEHDSVA